MKAYIITLWMKNHKTYVDESVNFTLQDYAERVEELVKDGYTLCDVSEADDAEVHANYFSQLIEYNGYTKMED